MNEEAAILALSALSNVTRLHVFRFLMKRAPEGVAAGDISDVIDIAPSNLSFHLTQLVDAKLVQSEKKGRYIYYAPDIPNVKGLIDFLTDDCCNGHPEICLA